MPFIVERNTYITISLLPFMFKSNHLLMYFLFISDFIFNDHYTLNCSHSHQPHTVITSKENQNVGKILKVSTDQRRHCFPFLLFFFFPVSLASIPAASCFTVSGTAWPEVLRCSNNLLRDGNACWHARHFWDSFTCTQKMSRFCSIQQS